MARVKDRQKVIELRKLGKTYSEIRRELDIPKSTLSDWLSKYPLTDEQIKLLEKSIKRNKDLAVEKIRLTKDRKRRARLRNFYDVETKRWLPLSGRELELAGLFLYWGEGSKSLKGALSLNNTDPQVLKFTLHWLIGGLKVPKEKIRVFLHLYSDMNVDQEMRYWGHQLHLPLSQFRKPYIKESTRIGIDHKGFGHGTCGLYIGDVRLKEKVIMAIQSIADYYSSKL